MKTIIISSLCTLLLLPAVAFAAPSEALTLRAQLHLAKLEIAQLRATLADAQAKAANAALAAALEQAKTASAALTVEREELARELRIAYGCVEDAAVDWRKVGAGEPPCGPR